MGRASRTPRTLPFDGFSRGVPIVGQSKPAEPQAPTKGTYHYHFPLLVLSGGKLSAESFEAGFPEKLDGATFYGIVREHERRRVAAEMARPRGFVERALMALRLKRAAPRELVPLQPVFLGFVAAEEPKPETADAPAAEPEPEGVAAG